MGADKGKMTTQMILNEGRISLRALLPEEIEQLRKIEASNQQDPGRSLARYMPLITAAAANIEPRPGAMIPSDMSPLDYMLGTEDYRGLWLIVRELYDLSGIAWNQAMQTAFDEALARIEAGGPVPDGAL